MMHKIINFGTGTYYFSTQGCKGLRLCVSLLDAAAPLPDGCKSFGFTEAPFRNASIMSRPEKTQQKLEQITLLKWAWQKLTVKLTHQSNTLR